MKVIGIIGSKIAGKETAAKYIAANYHGKQLAHSDILFEILSILHVEARRDNVIHLSALREKFGEDVLINAVNKKISEIDAPLVVVTGIRFKNELENIRAYPDSKIIYINSPIELRYQRQLHRASRVDDKNMTFDEFIALEKRNTEEGIAELGKSADYVIDNSGSLQDFHAALDLTMKEILK